MSFSMDLSYSIPPPIPTAAPIVKETPPPTREGESTIVPSPSPTVTTNSTGTPTWSEVSTEPPIPSGTPTKRGDDEEGDSGAVSAKSAIGGGASNGSTAGQTVIVSFACVVAVMVGIAAFSRKRSRNGVPPSDYSVVSGPMAATDALVQGQGSSHVEI
jgi:hypothetical protein